MKMHLEDPKSFLAEGGDKLHYVGFMKSPQRWIPLCYASDPDTDAHLDTLFVAGSYREMDEVLKSYAARVPEVQETLIQYLLPEEILNLVERYGLQRLAYLLRDEEATGGCDCGCGCG